jgi:alpha-galactosidase
MPIHLAENGWILETNNTAYAFGISGSQHFVHRYWGKKLPNISDYPPAQTFGEFASFNGTPHLSREEYPAYGGGVKYHEPCLKVTFEDGVRDVWLTFQRAIHVPEANVLAIALYDTHYPLRVYVQYRVWEEFDVIERYVEIQNQGEHPITIERALSAQWHLPYGGEYDLLHLAGRYNDEWQVQRERLTYGINKFDSKRGTSSHNQNPSFVIAHKDTTESHGDAWFGALEWSGNWQLIGEVTDFDHTRFSMGLNDWDFAYTLQPNKDLQTPAVFLGFTPHGITHASQHLHDFIRSRLPHPQATRKVLFNSWEVTLFDPDELSQKEYASLAADLGVELFVMDDGWFNKRNSDMAGLGDWFADSVKFPNDIQPLVEHINQLGMDFGLWIEPEMVNPDSDLYRAHPEWALHFPTRERTTARNQLILNMALTDVQDYLIEAIDKLLRDHNIAFIKWDMNRNITEAGWQTDTHHPKEIWLRYVDGVYRVWATLREKHPHVIWQACSGGGGRADMGVLNYADQIWISDNTDPTRRIPMQRGFSLIYPANTMEAWVTDMGADYLSLEFRFHVSMSGLLGVGADITKWNSDQRATAKRLIQQYKEIRHIVQFGDLYRLPTSYHDGYSALQYVSKDQSEGVLFVFRQYIPNPAHPYQVTLRGLKPEKNYHIDGFGTKSGQAWMNVPMAFDLFNFESKLLKIKPV